MAKVARTIGRTITGQIHLAPAAFAFALLMLGPNADRDALVVPLDGQSPGETINWFNHNGMQVVAAGRFGSTFVVRQPTSLAMSLRAIGNGWAMLPVDRIDCGSSSGKEIAW